jgi:hypothetical protein
MLNGESDPFDDPAQQSRLKAATGEEINSR